MSIWYGCSVELWHWVQVGVFVRMRIELFLCETERRFCKLIIEIPLELNHKVCTEFEFSRFFFLELKSTEKVWIHWEMRFQNWNQLMTYCFSFSVSSIGHQHEIEAMRLQMEFRVRLSFVKLTKAEKAHLHTFHKNGDDFESFANREMPTWARERASTTWAY